ncbi:hypothetical protein Lepto7376_4537 [[Leptolyngbya] sp. PCC 7376]|uniref:hypothetical protein n=1 Tax=[Leptolyngbya] sp. PCC 7376 TaxID=111781 RepID=UPI00029EDB34|nr:hypothetical protein [[Leptolyngbya] sp. PCC 7376]AFY40635.1 hypothetical protein Lepto7376_4537 [[Leptolyngbya] sp. PCC 7376]
MNTVNWQTAKGRHRSDLVRLHPQMFIEQGFLVNKAGIWVKYDKSYVVHKLYKTLNHVASVSLEDWQQALESASQMYMQETGSEYPPVWATQLTSETFTDISLQLQLIKDKVEEWDNKTTGKSDQPRWSNVSALLLELDEIIG